MSNTQDFFNTVAPVALAISAMTTGKMLPETLMVQFADETGWHQEGVWQGKADWKGKFNLAGISPNGKIADYPSYKEFEDAYVKTIEQNAFGFPQVLISNNVISQCIALGRSEWAGSHYDAAGRGSRPGHDLVSMYNNYQTEIEQAIKLAKEADKPPAPPLQTETPSPQPPQNTQPEPAPQTQATVPKEPSTVPAPFATTEGIYMGGLFFAHNLLAGNMIFDSGSSVHMISPDIAKAMNLPTPKEDPTLKFITISGVVGSEKAYQTKVSFKVGDREYKDQPAVVPPVWNNLEDGLFGVTEFCYQNKVKAVYDPLNGNVQWYDAN